MSASAEISPAPSGGPRRAALGFIFVTIALDALAMGIVVPVLPRLVEGFVGGDTARAAAMYGVFGTAWALMQFVFSPVQGALSDRFGRRPVILASNFGLGADYILMALAPNLHWLFAGRVISGITAASFSTASAYIADVMPPERRASGFGLVGAAWGVGFIIGPALGGVLGAVDPRLPFWFAGGLGLLNACYGLFVLPESLPPERREPLSWRRANPIGALALLRSNPQLFGLAGVSMLSYLAHNVLPSVFVLYAGYRYGWTERLVGLTLAGVGACGIIVQAGLVRPFVRRVGERRALVSGLLFGAAGFAAYGLAPTGALFWLGMPLHALMGFYGPASQGLMTRYVKPTEQGRLQGASSSLMGITGLVAPTIFTQTFAHAIAKDAPVHLPGAPFLVSALLLTAAAALGWRVTRGVAPQGSAKVE